MSRTKYPGAQFDRGFILGQLYANGHPITTALIRKLGASQATAKRDMARIRTMVPVLTTRSTHPQRTVLPPQNATARRAPRHVELSA